MYLEIKVSRLSLYCTILKQLNIIQSRMPSPLAAPASRASATRRLFGLAAFALAAF
jgi:hypothetical protein